MTVIYGESIWGPNDTTFQAQDDPLYDIIIFLQDTYKRHSIAPLWAQDLEFIVIIVLYVAL